MPSKREDGFSGLIDGGGVGLIRGLFRALRKVLRPIRLRTLCRLPELLLREVEALVELFIELRSGFVNFSGWGRRLIVLLHNDT